IDDELEFHLDAEIQANIARGALPSEARRLALRDLGGLTQTREAAREVRMTWLDDVARDVRHAERGLIRTAGFTSGAVVTLWLGIGANTAIFSIVNGVILRPLGYPKSDQLMFLSTRSPALGLDSFWVSPVEYFEFRELNQSFSNAGAFHVGEVNLFDG